MDSVPWADIVALACQHARARRGRTSGIANVIQSVAVSQPQPGPMGTARGSAQSPEDSSSKRDQHAPTHVIRDRHGLWT